jgi:3-hydroxybutyryl-CoA dehydrogenase
MTDLVRRPIAVVGAGFMGAVIATLYARYGYPVRLTDIVDQNLETFRDRARPIAEALAGSEADKLLDGVGLEGNLPQAVKDAVLVHEIIHEDLSAKQAIFTELDRLCEADVVLGTNTSSLKLSEITRNVKHRERVIGLHFITPAHVVKIVEVIKTDFTSQKLIDWARDFLKSIDRVGVVCADTPGFLVNRLQYALIAEAYRIVESGIASREDVDATYRLSLGPRLALWGPLLTEDLVVSKKTTAAVWDYLHEKIGDEQFRRPPAVDRFVASGELGAVAGAGWYHFGADYPLVVKSRDSQLESLLKWLAENDRRATFTAS